MDCFASLAMTKSTTGVDPMTTPLAAKIAREYGTPCAVIDMDRVERNIARIQAACDAAGVANGRISRPTRARYWRRCRSQPARKASPARKLGEAEVMAEAGIGRHPDQLQSDRRRKNGPARNHGSICRPQPVMWPWPASASSRAIFFVADQIVADQDVVDPASAISSARGFWQVMPFAPAATCICANSGLLWS